MARRGQLRRGGVTATAQPSHLAVLVAWVVAVTRSGRVRLRTLARRLNPSYDPPTVVTDWPPIALSSLGKAQHGRGEGAVDT